MCLMGQEGHCLGYDLIGARQHGEACLEQL